MSWEMYEPNPVRTGAIDCAVRAIAKALDVSWETAYAMLSANGFLMGNSNCADEVWGSVLRQHGFTRYMIPDDLLGYYTVEDFAEDHSDGIFVVKSENHVATIVNGTLYDSWPSMGKTVIFYWRKDD